MILAEEWGRHRGPAKILLTRTIFEPIDRVVRAADFSCLMSSCKISTGYDRTDFEFGLEFGNGLDSLIESAPAIVVHVYVSTCGNGEVTLSFTSYCSLPGAVDQPLVHVQLLRDVQAELMIAAAMIGRAKRPEAVGEELPDDPAGKYPATVIADLKSALKSLGYAKAEVDLRAQQAVELAPPNSDLRTLISFSLRKN